MKRFFQLFSYWLATMMAILAWIELSLTYPIAGILIAMVVLGVVGAYWCLD